MPGARRGAGARLLSWALPPRRTGVPYLDALACLLAQHNTWLPSAHTIPHTIPLLRRWAHTIPLLRRWAHTVPSQRGSEMDITCRLGSPLLRP